MVQIDYAEPYWVAFLTLHIPRTFFSCGKSQTASTLHVQQATEQPLLVIWRLSRFEQLARKTSPIVC